jgi:catechol 2,3-dioxygenase-like lactoylglutathione lyase family enzyme
MSNLENLRKRAKRYLRWHRDRYYPVAAHIRATLPRYRTFTDRDVLDKPFRLSDAQELVARQNGFENWQALRKGVQAVTETNRESDETDNPVLFAVEAQLFVGDLNKSCEYYTTTLGFTVVFAYGDPAFYGQVQRDGARLNLRLVCEPIFVGDIREREQLLAAVVTMTSAVEHRDLFLQYRDNGVDFSQALTDEPWGARTFIVRDPDGNLILFSAPGG